jgi:hypothetical protein
MRIAVSILFLLIAGPVSGRSQTHTPSDDELRFVTGIEWVGAVAASGYVASLGCGNGDPAVWKRVVEAVDRRYRQCVKLGSVQEQAVTRHFAGEWRYATALGLDPSAGTLAFERWLPRRERGFAAEKASDRCSSVYMRTLMAPDSVPKAELDAEYKRSLHAQGDIETVIAVRRLGEDLKWLESPCDEFFPTK